MLLSNHVFLVTGGASGLGRAVAERFVRGGAKVVLVDRNEKVGIALSESLGDGVVFCKADVADEMDGRTAVGLALEAFGQLNGLVNCAGVAPSERILGKEAAHDLARFAQTIRINLIGSFNMMRLAAQAMALNAPNEGGERGVVINTSSIAAYDGQIGQAAYAASKGGVASLTLPAARELARTGIRVVAIAPGVFETPMMDAMPETVRDALAATVPFPSRFGRPDEYAALVEHVVCNAMLNGEVIRIDGALRMAPR